MKTNKLHDTSTGSCQKDSNPSYDKLLNTSTTTVDPSHFEVKEICIANPIIIKEIFSFPEFAETSMLKIGPIHQFNLDIQQILKPHDLKVHVHFWPRPHKN